MPKLSEEAKDIRQQFQNRLIGSRLKRIREALGETPGGLLCITGKSSSQVSKMETGKLPLTIEVIFHLILIYKVNPVYLFLGDGQMFMDDDYYIDGICRSFGIKSSFDVKMIAMEMQDPHFRFVLNRKISELKELAAKSREERTIVER